MEGSDASSFIPQILAGWLERNNMKNRKATKHTGIFTYESRGLKLYGLKFHHRGTQVQKQGFTTLATAKQAKAEIMEKIETGEYFRKEYTLDEYFQIFRDIKMKTQKWNRSTESSATSTYNKHLKPKFGNKKLELISRTDIELFVSELSTRLRQASIRAIVGLLSSILQHAYTNEVLSRNRAAGIYIGKGNKPPIDKSLSADDYETVKQYLISNYDIMHQAMFMLLSYGLRRGEVLAIRESVITYNSDYTMLYIDSSRTKMYPEGKGTKTGNNRNIFISIEDTILLNEAIKLSKQRYLSSADKTYTKDSWIFVDDDANPFTPNRMTAVLEKIKYKTGIHISPHVLRHYFASQAQSTNINPRLIADFLGHTKTTMTDQYSHPTIDGGLLVMQKVNDKIN